MRDRDRMVCVMSRSRWANGGGRIVLLVSHEGAQTCQCTKFGAGDKLARTHNAPPKQHTQNRFSHTRANAVSPVLSCELLAWCCCCEMLAISARNIPSHSRALSMLLTCASCSTLFKFILRAGIFSCSSICRRLVRLKARKICCHFVGSNLNS